MSEWSKKYARSRDQLYHLKVLWRQLEEQMPEKRRTDEATQVISIVSSVLDAAAQAFEEGCVLVVQVDAYKPLVLPGFEGELNENTDFPFEG